MTLAGAVDMSWEQLNALAAAHERRTARTMLLFMTAAQGSEESWKNQRQLLLKIIHPK